ncbi:MAG: hypothetical protein M3256_24805, partial [Actinomycetota bacterium]|nr:hypothetical protein [Actinomycetota bacterium]
MSRPDIITLAEDAVGMISLSVKYPPLPPPRTTQRTVRAHRQPLSIDSTVQVDRCLAPGLDVTWIRGNGFPMLSGR